MPEFKKKIEEISEQIGNKIEENRSLLETAQKEERDLSDEETKTFDQNKESMEDLRAQQKRYISQVDVEEWAEESATSGPESGRQEPGEKNRRDEKPMDKQVREAFKSYMRYGYAGLKTEERKVLNQRKQELSDKEQRALATETGTAGGYTVPEGFREQLIEAMQAFSGMREANTTILPTESGNDIPIPTGDDTGNTGALLSENTAASEQDMTFGAKTLKAHKYTSKIIRVPIELLQDSGIDIEAYVNRKGGERIGRVTNQHFTTGTGSNQPQGVVTGAVSDTTAASATAVTYDELVTDLVHDVNRAYRRNDGQYMFNDTTFKAIKQLKDSNNRYYFQPDPGSGALTSIGGAGYIVNDDMPDMTTGNKAILYGDFSYYFIRDVMDVMMLRLTERYAEYGQVGFLMFARHDGLYANPDDTSGPIKAITMA